MTNKAKIKQWFNNLLIVPNRLIVTPFKTFEQIKEGQQGGFWQATFWLLAFCFVEVLAAQYMVFFLNKTNLKTFNGINLFFTILIPLLVLVVSNWAVTTIFSGSGRMREIYQVLAFSLYPLVIIKMVTILLSQFIAEGDIALLRVVNLLGLVIFGYLIFVGLVVVHEFGFFKNILMILLSLFAFAVVFYIIFLVFMLLQQTTGFMYQLIEEIIFRVKL